MVCSVDVTEAKIKHLEEKFGVLVAKTKKKVKQKSPDLDAFCMKITLLPVKLKKQHPNYIKEQALKICSASSIDEIFYYLNLYWDYLNYGLLEYIVGIYGDDETKHEMKEYHEEVETFRSETSLRELCTVQPTQCTRDLKKDLNYCNIEIKHGNLTLDSLLQDTEHFRQDLASEYSFHPCALILVGIKPGCVLTLWAIHSILANYLKDKIQEGQEFLRNHHVLKVKMNEDTIYKAETSGKC